MKIHLVFYISLLEIVLERALSVLRIEIEPINLIAEYEVKKVLDYRKRNNIIKYLIK